MSQLPTLKKQQAQPVAIKEEKPIKVFTEPVAEPSIAEIKIPVLDPMFDGYFTDRVDVRLSQLQKDNLRIIFHGLQNRFAKLQNGKEVSNAQDAIKWILENVATL